MDAALTADRRNTRTELLDRVEAVSATLASQCEAEEEQGTLSMASVEALRAAGVFAMKLPKVLGGAEADPVTQFAVIEAIAAISSSAGWCSMVGATSVALPGAFLPDEGIARMFGDGRLPLCASVAMPAGEAEPVAGGFRLNGRWSFASGVRHAQWVTVGSRVNRGGSAPPEIWSMVLPAADVTIHDNWHVAGLQGTGSCDISVDDRIVPHCMAWNSQSAPQRGGPLYHLGIPAFVANEHVAFALGVARRALDALVATAAAKRRGFGPGASSLAARSTVQRMIGHSDLRLRAARALAVELNEEAWQTVVAGRVPDARLQAALRGVATYGTEVAAEVTTQAFRYVGGSAIYATNVMQRCLRDVQVAAQHLVVSDSAYENLGQFMLGFEDAQPMR